MHEIFCVPKVGLYVDEQDAEFFQRVKGGEFDDLLLRALGSKDGGICLVPDLTPKTKDYDAAVIKAVVQEIQHLTTMGSVRGGVGFQAADPNDIRHARIFQADPRVPRQKIAAIVVEQSLYAHLQCKPAWVSVFYRYYSRAAMVHKEPIRLRLPSLPTRDLLELRTIEEYLKTKQRAREWGAMPVEEPVEPQTAESLIDELQLQLDQLLVDSLKLAPVQIKARLRQVVDKIAAYRAAQ